MQGNRAQRVRDAILRGKQFRETEARVDEKVMKLLKLFGLEASVSRSANRSLTASSAGWRSYARSPPARACCCSMSQPPE